MIFYPHRRVMISQLPPQTVGAEIGVLRGDFSAQVLSCPVRRLYLVDPWAVQDPKVYEDTWNECDHANNLQYVRTRFATEIANGRVVIIQGLSEEVAAHVEVEPLDWVFIDGNHQYPYVLQDLLAWEKRLKPTGIIMGHDYTDRTGFGVIKSVTEFCKTRPWEVDALTQESDWPSYRLRRTA